MRLGANKSCSGRRVANCVDPLLEQFGHVTADRLGLAARLMRQVEATDELRLKNVHEPLVDSLSSGGASGESSFKLRSIVHKKSFISSAATISRRSCDAVGPLRFHVPTATAQCAAIRTWKCRPPAEVDEAWLRAAPSTPTSQYRRRKHRHRRCRDSDFGSRSRAPALNSNSSKAVSRDPPPRSIAAMTKEGCSGETTCFSSRSRILESEMQPIATALASSTSRPPGASSNLGLSRLGWTHRPLTIRSKLGAFAGQIWRGRRARWSGCDTPSGQPPPFRSGGEGRSGRQPFDLEFDKVAFLRSLTMALAIGAGVTNPAFQIRHQGLGVLLAKCNAPAAESCRSDCFDL